MVREVRIPPQGFIPPVQPASDPSRSGQTPRVVGPSFSEVLLSQVAARNRIGFSAHAQQRIADRNIQLSPDDLDRIADGVNRAEKKGARESLLLLRDTAFVVSVRNRTVVTAVDGNSLKDNVFTNIDSAVFV